MPAASFLADNPAHSAFSQQSNVLAVLFDVIPPEQQQGVLLQVLAIDPGTAPGGVLSCSYYFRFIWPARSTTPEWLINTLLV
jgi:hypothetical protein